MIKMMVMPSKTSSRYSQIIDSPIGSAQIYSLREAQTSFGIDLGKLPFSFRILLENLLRNLDGGVVTSQDIQSLASRNVGKEIPYMPTRVILQDFTGVPLIVDLAAMRDKVRSLGFNPDIVEEYYRSCIRVSDQIVNGYSNYAMA